MPFALPRPTWLTVVGDSNILQISVPVPLKL
jgi:hypothetical protein